MGTIIVLQKPDFSFDAVIEPTITATWVEFVKFGEARAERCLSEELESFLVFTLMRFAERTDLFLFTLALEYLKASTEYSGRKKEQTLSEVGDISLILAGLFPGRSQRLGVHPSYFSQMGRMAFSELADSYATRKLRGLEGLYRNVGDGFSVMADVLTATREKKLDYNPA